MPSINWPWAIVLCKYNDMPAETRPANFYWDMFARNGTGGMCDFWRVITSGAMDISSSVVFGWLTMTHASAEAKALQYPAGRATLFQWGLDAAHAAGINLAPFRAILVLQNFGVDHGAVTIGGNPGEVVIVHADPNAFECGFVGHEMGHGFGLPHSWSANPDFQYGDGWDLMSWQTSTFNFNVTFEGASGLATVGLNARNLEALGAVPPGRVWQPSPDFSGTVTLDPMSQLPIGNHGSLFAKILPTSTRPVRTNGSSYTVEFHQKAGWDQGIPADVVTIHEIRTDTLSYLQPTRGSSFIQGQTFTTPAPAVSVLVTAIDTTLGTATVRIWDLPDGSLRKEDSTPNVYLIQNGTKRWITSPAALFALGKTWADVRVVPDGALAGLPAGANISVLNVSVTPFPVPVGHAVSVTVHVTANNNPVAGVVKVDGVQVSTTNTPFTHTFNRIRKVGPPPEREPFFVYPSGDVEVPGFPATSIDFGFPDI